MPSLLLVKPLQWAIGDTDKPVPIPAMAANVAWNLATNSLLAVGLVIAILITAVFGPSAVNAIIAIGIFNTPVFARVTRGAALSLWTLDYVKAARVAGKGTARISVEHILPNVANLLIVQGTIQFSLGILAEAGLSYVGLGAQPPTPSWGGMLGEGRVYMLMQWWLAAFPGLAIFVTTISINLVGEALRDILDPRF